MKNTLQSNTLRRSVRRVPPVCRRLSAVVLHLNADQAWQLLGFASLLLAQTGDDGTMGRGGAACQAVDGGTVRGRAARKADGGTTVRARANTGGARGAASEVAKGGVVHGIMGIAAIFGCSRSTAQRIKHSGAIDGALRQVGRTIVVDVDEALHLAEKDYEKRTRKATKNITKQTSVKTRVSSPVGFSTSAPKPQNGQTRPNAASQPPYAAPVSSLSSFSSSLNNNYYYNNNRVKGKKEEKEEKSESLAKRLPPFDAHQAMTDLVPQPYRAAFGRWLDYKDELGQQYRSAATLRVCADRLVQLAGHDPVRAMQVVDQSIVAGWRGLFPLHSGVAGGETVRPDEIGVVLRNDSYDKFKDVKGW